MRHMMALIIIFLILSFIVTWGYYKILRAGFDFDKGTDK